MEKSAVDDQVSQLSAANHSDYDYNTSSASATTNAGESRTMAKTRGASKTKATRAEATKAKKSPAAKAKKPAAKAKKTTAVAAATGGKVLSIEACKQWSVFKTRAGKIQKYLAQQGAAVDVVINKEKPGKGNFVLRLEGREEPILELLGMKRPFSALKALDMDDIGKEVMDAL